MNMRGWLYACIGFLLVFACNFPTTPALKEQPTQTATFESISSPLEYSSTVIATNTSPVTPSPQATGTNANVAKTNCLSENDNPIAQIITEDFEFTNYLEVMSWFCNGAAFEDILTALQTEELNGTPAEEMLKMLADGLSWEEIWQLIDLME